MKRKKVLTIILLVFTICLTGCNDKEKTSNKKNSSDLNKKEVEQKANTNPGIINNQTLDDITIEQTSLIFEEGTSTLTTSIRNNDKDNITINSVKIIFKDAAGNIIVMLDGYIGETIEPGNGKLLTSHVDQDLMHATDVEYELNK